MRPVNNRKAFWLNAYNALVLKTVIDHYPIRGQFSEYPTNSIRQIPGAFAQRTHRVAGRDLTLDSIETTVLTELSDPRLFWRWVEARLTAADSGARPMSRHDSRSSWRRSSKSFPPPLDTSVSTSWRRKSE